MRDLRLIILLLMAGACESGDRRFFGRLTRDNDTECNTKNVASVCTDPDKPHCGAEGTCVATGTTKEDCARVNRAYDSVSQHCRLCKRNSECSSQVCWMDDWSLEADRLPYEAGSCVPTEVVAYVQGDTESCPPAGVMPSSIETALTSVDKKITRLCGNAMSYGNIEISIGNTVRIVGEDRDCDLPGRGACSIVDRVVVKNGNVTLMNVHVRPPANETGVLCIAPMNNLRNRVHLIRSVITSANYDKANTEAANGLMAASDCSVVIDKSHIHSFSQYGVQVTSSAAIVINSVISGIGSSSSQAAIYYRDDPANRGRFRFLSLAESGIALECNQTPHSAFTNLYSHKNGPDNGCLSAPSNMVVMGIGVPDRCERTRNRTDCIASLSTPPAQAANDMSLDDEMVRTDYEGNTRKLCDGKLVSGALAGSCP